MIRLSNGHEFEYVAASGALGFYGEGWLHQRLRAKGMFDLSLFTIISKTVRIKPREGNFLWYAPWRCIRLILENGQILGVHHVLWPSINQKIIGTHNAVGLTGPGINRWIEGAYHYLSNGPALILSFHGEPEELAQMAEWVKFSSLYFGGFSLRGVEINSWCPNMCSCDSKKEYVRKTIKSCEAVKKLNWFPVLLKLPWIASEDTWMIKEIIHGINGIVEALDINSIPWYVVFPGKPSPLAHLGGGAISGKIAQPYTWNMLQRLVDITDIPVIGPSVWEYEDIGKLRKMGAKAISFGSVFLPYPWRPTELIRRDMKEKLECLAIEAFCDMNQ